MMPPTLAQNATLSKQADRPTDPFHPGNRFLRRNRRADLTALAPRFNGSPILFYPNLQRAGTAASKAANTTHTGSQKTKSPTNGDHESTNFRKKLVGTIGLEPTTPTMSR